VRATDDLLTLIPASLREPVDMREVIVRLVDAGTMLEFKPLWEGKPVFISDVAKDATLQQRTWIRGEGFASFAAYPLMLEERLVGCMALFSREPQAETVLQELASVANGIALCIQRKQAEDALDASESRYQSVVSSIKEVVFQITESGQWAFLNPAWTRITGFAIQETLGTMFLDYFSSDTRELVSKQLERLLAGETDHGDLEAKLATQLGDFRWVELSLSLTAVHSPDAAIPGTDISSATIDGRGRSVSGSLNDITDRKRAEEELLTMATTDFLTGLPSRRSFIVRLEDELARLNDGSRSLPRSPASPASTRFSNWLIRSCASGAFQTAMTSS
jgi:PAS domain S-box-containing protein